MGGALEYVVNQTEEICKCALEYETFFDRDRKPYILDTFASIKIELQTEEICKIAVSKYWATLQFVKKEFQTEEICKLAIEQDLKAFKFIEPDCITEEVHKFYEDCKLKKYYENLLLKVKYSVLIIGTLSMSIKAISMIKFCKR